MAATLSPLRAADILRTKSGSGASGGAAAAAQAGAIGTTQTPGSISATELLSRSANSLQAIAAMQAAARAAALAGARNLVGSVPVADGFNQNTSSGLAQPTSGPGLQIAVTASGAPVLWQGASLPTAGTGSNANQVAIAQNQPQALLRWQTFDIGKNTTLTFDQSAGGANASQWIAFNYVQDPSARPSQILGTLNTIGQPNAQGVPQVGGQVYVINTNGVIFGGSSQVNAHSLVVSSLPINPNLVANGLLNDTSNFQFLFSSSDIDQLGQATAAGTDAFGDSSTSPDYVAPPPAGGYGDVTVQPGAQLTSPAGAGNVGGAIILVGPNVTNAGTISTPSGQTILAAGLQVALTAHDNVDSTRSGVGVTNGVLAPAVAGSADDPSLRGLDAYVGAVVEPSVSTTNLTVQYVPQADGGTGLGGKGWSGVVTNENVGGQGSLLGVIQAPEGDVTMAGAVVNQLGAIESMTSVSLNGRVDLLANYNAAVLPGQTTTNAAFQPFAQQSSGLVNFGEDSVTQILTDPSGGTTVGTQLTLPSQIYVQAHSIYLAGTNPGTGAIVLAPSGDVSMSAGDWQPSSVPGVTSLNLQSGQIYLDKGASIDVSGSQNVSASVTDNVVSVQLRGTELADSPVQQGGPLQGVTVQVDITQTGTYNGQPWVGTPLAITTGYIGLIQRSIGELTTAGGTVNLSAGGSVVMQPGSSINVSGGWINYAGGLVQTTELLSGGQIYDIDQATPNLVYTGIYTGSTTSTDSKWGVTQTTANPIPIGTFETGYVQGGNGGAISITAPSIAPEGTFLGHTVDGARQIEPLNQSSLSAAEAAGIDPNIWLLSTVTSPSRLSFLLQGQEALSPGNEFWYSPSPPVIAISPDSSGEPTVGSFDPNGPGDGSTWSGTNIFLDPGLVQAVGPNASTAASGGFGVLNIENSDGVVDIPSNGAAQPALTLPEGGSMTLTAANIDVESAIAAPGGTLNFIAYGYSPYLTTIDSKTGGTQTYTSQRGNFTLGPSASLDVSGSVLDERGSSGPVQPLFTNGGSVTIKANNVDLVSGSSIDVSGGALVAAAGSVAYGSAGAVQISAGQDPFTGTPVINNDGSTNASAVGTTATDSVLGGGLTLGASLAGYSGVNGGTLGIQAPAIQIGGAEPEAETVLWLPSDADNVPFFSEGGFATFKLTGLGQANDGPDGVTYAPGFVIEPFTALHPIVQTWLADTASGVALTLQTLPNGMRPAVNLDFVAAGARNFLNQDSTENLAVRGNLVMGAGSSIVLDPVGTAQHPTPASSAEGTVTLKGDTVDVGGAITAPGGTINVIGATALPVFGPSLVAYPTVVLESGSVLSTSGQTILLEDAFGRQPGQPGYLDTGSVLGGGFITVGGNIVAQKGAELIANGSTGALALPATYSESEPDVSNLDPLENLSLTPVDTSGGTITLAAGQELFSAATLNAFSGNPADARASGGTLWVYGGYFSPNAQHPISTALDVGLMVTAGPPAFTYDGAPANPGAVSVGGMAVAPVLTNGFVSQALSSIDSETINQGGFANVVLQGAYELADSNASRVTGPPTQNAVNFLGDVTLGPTGSLTVAGSGFLFANGNVNLVANYVDLGPPFASPTVYTTPPPSPLLISAPPTSGSGSLQVTANQLIDVGNLSLQGIGSASFNAPGGAIRGDGTLDIAGDLTLTADQIFPPTEVAFNIAAYPSKTSTGTVAIEPGSGSSPQLPLSAGGELNIYASTITQGGTLEAPLGVINLGASAAVVDPLTGGSFPATGQVTLASGSVTSTSNATNALMAPSAAGPVPIPYGLYVTGTGWIDPSGSNITIAGNGLLGAGLPSQAVNLVAANVSIQPASGSLAAAKIDVSGGGDLMAYQWVPGTGGTVDVLAPSISGAAPTSFAIIPGFTAGYAPFGPYGSNNATANSLNDLGYTNAAAAGTQVYLNAASGVPAGVYTLLPARYALLPGAFLVTPETGTPANPAVQSDGSEVVSGYVFNAFTGEAAGSSLYSNFDVAPLPVVQHRAQYTLYSANTVFPQQALAQGVPTPRLPQDAGLLAIEASNGVDLQGEVDGQPGTGGRGSLVEISGPPNSAIVINGTGIGSASDTLYLNAAQLSSFGAEGLLVGGLLASAAGVSTVTVTTDNLEVGEGATLSAGDVILVANDSLKVDTGSIVESQGPATDSIGNLLLGQVGVEGSGDGVVVRVSNDPSAEVNRVGVLPFSGSPTLEIGSGAQILGGSGSLTLDSTSNTSLDPSAVISAAAINLGSGQVAIQLDPTVALPTGSPALVFSGNVLQSFQNSATSLSLLSYTSIDLYGGGQIGATDMAGNPRLGNLALHAGEIRGFGSNAGATVGVGADVTFNAQTILLDNSPGGAGPGPVSGSPPTAGNLTFNGNTIEVGVAHSLDVDQFGGIELAASNGISIMGAGAPDVGLFVQGSLSMQTPQVSSATGANGILTSQGPITVTSGSTPLETFVPGGIGANVTLQGSSVSVGANSLFDIPSGTLTLHATNGDVSVAGGLNAGGTSQQLASSTEYTNGGRISLVSDTGNVTIGSGGAVSTAAQAGAGDGGTFSVSAPMGGLTLSGSVFGQGGAGGAAGSATIDVSGLHDTNGQPTSALDPLEAVLDAGGFTQSQTIRVRSGDVTFAGTAAARTFDLSADTGSINVSGTIDASGVTGGTIDLSAGGSVVLAGGSFLNARGDNFNDAGQGGSVSLTAGTSQFTNGAYVQNPNAYVTIAPNSKIDLSIANNDPVQLNLSGQSSISVPGGQPVTFPSGTPGDDQVTFSAGGTLALAGGATTSFPAGFTTAVTSGSVVVFPGGSPGSISFAPNGSGGSIPIDLPVGVALAETEVTDLSPYNFTGTLQLRAPQILENGKPVDVQISPISGTIVSPSSIVVQGNQVFVPMGGSIDSVEGAIQTNGAEFAGGLNSSGVLQAGNTSAVVARLTSTWGSGPGQVNSILSTQPDALVHLQPAAEIDDPTGSLTLEDSWDLSTYRFGPNAVGPTGNPILGAGEPGTLTLRAAGDIVFAYDPNAANMNATGKFLGGYASLSDGFGAAGGSGAASTPNNLWQETLLPTGSESWSYQIVAGADFGAADYSQVQAGVGSVQLGSVANAPTPVEQLAGTTTRNIVVPAYYQVIRTGTGDVSIFAGLDVQSLNPLATVYTAGQQAPALAGFSTPDLAYNGNTFIGPSQLPVYPAQYSFNGGNLTIDAGQNIVQDEVVNGQIVADSSKEMPTSWLYRQGYLGANGNFAVVPSGVVVSTGRGAGTTQERPGTGNVASTSWWIDFSNYFEGVGALGGGNVSLVAGADISNVDAAVPTNARMPGVDPSTGIPLSPANAAVLEIGGGDLSVQAGGNISGGVYYVERGTGTLDAGGQILTNATRTTLPFQQVAGLPAGTGPDPATWLPTTLFVGNSSFAVNAVGDVTLGAVVNPFLLPQGINNSFWEKTYFSTYSSQAGVDVTSLTGSVTLADSPQVEQEGASLYTWYSSLMALSTPQSAFQSDSTSEPWLLLSEGNIGTAFASNSIYPTTVFGLMPPSLRTTAFSGDVNIQGGLTLSPAPTGTADLLASGSINGLQINGIQPLASGASQFQWASSVINVSNADPSAFPGITTPLSLTNTPPGLGSVIWWASPTYDVLNGVDLLINESSIDESSNAPLQQREALNDAGLLHAGDPNPIQIEAETGDISGITLFSPKAAVIDAGQDITNIAVYIQNNNASDVSVVAAGRDLIAYDPTAPLLQQAQFPASTNQLLGGPLSGDIQVSGPGTLEVLTGRNLNLGVGSSSSGNSGAASISGISSVGSGGNPFLPFGGADIVAAAGLGEIGDLSSSQLGFSSFIAQYIDPSTAGANASRYLPELAAMLGQPVASRQSAASIWTELMAPYAGLPAAEQLEHEDLLALDGFYIVLRDAGRDQNNPSSPNFGTYGAGDAAIADLFPGSATSLNAATANSPWSGSVSLATREIVTTNGGNIAVLAPGGSVIVGNPGDPQRPDQGLLTEFGGNISIFSEDDVGVGTSRIFTLRGGSETIWSSIGNIAAGSGSKTVFSAPPTRVLVDPQSATVQNDLAGLATGSGIGVLATLTGVAPADVDLIAPVGTVDAGDAGIRSSGNLNIAALHVLNASNIQVSGVSSGVPVAAVPNVAGFAAASNSAAASANASSEMASRQQSEAQTTGTMVPSIITVEVLGYGGGDDISVVPQKTVDLAGS